MAATEPQVHPRRRKRQGKANAGMAALLLGLMLLIGVGTTSTASAAAYTKSVYTPARSGSTMTGWADLSLDCAGTFGCWNYLKIEKWGYFGNSWVNGWWANNNGWNSVTAWLPGGCGYYRTTVDSYNDATGPVGGGITIGQVGWTLSGQAIYRFRTTWSSGWAYYCY